MSQIRLSAQAVEAFGNISSPLSVYAGHPLTSVQSFSIKTDLEALIFSRSIETVRGIKIIELSSDYFLLIALLTALIC